ncbi:MAG: DUF1800 domain-containing protein, partial [Verrucomicrobia bacterium]|nr:DUF1800 domain-containing protein [Verrucomicrobiota bacterium]
RLRFRLHAQRGTGNSWTLTYEIWNQTKNQRILLRTYANSTAASSVDAGTANWMDAQNVIGRSLIETAQGVQVRFSPTLLHTRPQYAAHKDTDNDGMPDSWESANGLSLNQASDALGDRDNDGVNARDEYLLGLNPRNPDSDGDGIADGIERFNRSNPASAISRPAYAGFVWPIGEDLNGDGLPDAWQARYNAYGIGVGSDNDGDGQSNSQEALWGTNPFDPASKIVLTITAAPPDIHLTWPHQPLKQQTLFWTTNAPNWVAYDADPLTDNGTSRVILANRIELNPGELYRVDTYDVDSDGDGVTDWAEGLLGMDPFDADSSRLPVRSMTSTGVVTGSVSGDYVTFVERMRQAPGVGAQQMTRSQAARFLRQATFGPTSKDLDQVQHLGFAAWIDDQVQNKVPTLHADYIRGILRDYDGPRKDDTYSSLEIDSLLRGANVLTSFARASIAGQDQLRQRVAFALSQILVISRRNGDLQHRPLSVASFHDIFVRHAFGSYYDILREVTLSPVMGHYLSHVGNQKAILSINQFPDENYAREVKQLFSIGLWELNPDGTRKVNGLGQNIPTYGNEEITEFARVFTGLWFGGQLWGVGGSNDKDLVAPMELWPDKHDFGAKTLLNGFVVPARTPSEDNGIRDIEDALRNLVEHPNCAPFICRQLIQFLVTSNPSAAYVGRISAVFVNDGTGKRGNLGAVVKAILLDAEARDPRWSAVSTQYGRLREPVERTIALARLGDLGRHTGLLWWSYDDFAEATLQEPSFAPTVFNFYRPDYQPPGLMAAAGLVGPVFQITDTFSSIALPNKLWEIIEYGFVLSGSYAFPPDYTPLLAVADDPELLLDEINLILCGGEMTVPTRQTILAAMDLIGPQDRLTRVLVAVYVAATCPEGAVQR